MGIFIDDNALETFESPITSFEFNKNLFPLGNVQIGSTSRLAWSSGHLKNNRKCHQIKAGKTASLSLSSYTPTLFASLNRNQYLALGKLFSTQALLVDSEATLTVSAWPCTSLDVDTILFHSSSTPSPIWDRLLSSDCILYLHPASHIWALFLLSCSTLPAFSLGVLSSLWQPSQCVVKNMLQL